MEGEALEDIVVGGKGLGDPRLPLLQTTTNVFQQKEKINTKAAEYRLWYIEEGRIDELVAYMRQLQWNYKAQP